MYLIPPGLVAPFLQIKDLHEVSLARELYDVFTNSSELMRMLGLIAQSALEYMIALQQKLDAANVRGIKPGKGEVEPLLQTLKDESALKMWGDGKGGSMSGKQMYEHLIHMQTRRYVFTPNDCSEIMRLFGTAIENVVNWIQVKQKSEEGTSKGSTIINQPVLNMPDPRTIDELRKSYRSSYGNISSFSKEMQQQIVQQTRTDNSPNSAQPFALPFRGDVRKRWKVWVSGETGDVQLTEPDQKPQGEGYKLRGLTDEQKRFVSLYPSDGEGWAVRGMTLWKLKEGSVVWAIDRLFGLPPGADISGTTADIMCGLEVLTNIIFPPSKGGKQRIHQGLRRDFAPLLPFAYLLPIAAMVSHYHHTILECALTQTLNDVFEYSVGFYTTLMPKSKNLDPRLKGIFEAVLKKYENHPFNHRMLLFEKGKNTPWGVLFTAPGELASLKEFGKVNFERYMQVFHPLKDIQHINLDHVASKLPLSLAEMKKQLIQVSILEALGVRSIY